MAHGGKRVGAGRRRVKPSVSGKVNKATAEDILGQVDEYAAWLELLTATHTISVNSTVTDTETGKSESQREEITVPDWKTRLEARKYLTDKRDGKAPQAIRHLGEGDDAPEFKLVVRHITTPGAGAPAETKRAS